MDEDSITKENVQGCFLICLWMVFALVSSVAVGFLAGAGYGFLTYAGFVALLIARCYAVVRKEKKDGR